MVATEVSLVCIALPARSGVGGAPGWLSGKCHTEVRVSLMFDPVVHIIGLRPFDL